MKLEDEIKQKKFRNPYHKLTVNIIYTYNWMLPLLRSATQPYNITLQQYNILRILRGQHPRPSSLVLLRERMLDKQSDVSRLIDRLLVKNLVERTPCTEDRRKMDIRITDDGLNLLQDIDAKLLRVDDFLSRITPEEATQLNDLLDDLRG